MKGFILICMLFCHVVDDYYLQGILASMKQKAWWKKNSPAALYRYDYMMALLMHSFSWAFMIMLPLTICSMKTAGTWFPWLYIINMVIHFVVDDLKANRGKINLLADQSIHIFQIFLTWIWWIS